MSDAAINLHSGLASLDRAIEQIVRPGNSIIVGAPTGAGKTILTGQICGHRTWQCSSTLVISTEVPESELHGRMISAICNIRYRKIVDGIRFDEHGLLPESSFQLDARQRFGGLKIRAESVFRFRKIDSLTLDPSTCLHDIITEVMQNGFCPKVVIIDHINHPIQLFNGKNAGALIQSMVSASRSLKALAKAYGFFAIGFCQVASEHSHDAWIDPGCIAECKNLAEPADAFIGISQVYSEIGPLPYAPIQHMTVCLKGKPPFSIPVRRNFEFQKFEDTVPLDISKNPQVPAPPGVNHLTAVSTKIRKAENPGFVIMPRKRLEDLFAMQNRNCVNVYCFLALAANYSGSRDRKGVSYWSRAKIGEQLGLTEKSVRCALDSLIGSELVFVDGKMRRAVVHGIADWSLLHEPKNASNYFKLFRSLLDKGQRELLGNPELLRLWIYLLGRARVFREELTLEEPGTLTLAPYAIDEAIGLNQPNLEHLLGALESRGSILRKHSDGAVEVIIKNWDLYQNHLCTRKDKKSP